MDIKQIAFLEKELKLFGMAYVKNGEFVPNALHSSSSNSSDGYNSTQIIYPYLNFSRVEYIFRTLFLQLCANKNETRPRIFFINKIQHNLNTRSDDPRSLLEIGQHIVPIIRMGVGFQVIFYSIKIMGILLYFYDVAVLSVTPKGEKMSFFK